jgi:translocation and assembly module TamB
VDHISSEQYGNAKGGRSKVPSRTALRNRLILLALILAGTFVVFAPRLLSSATLVNAFIQRSGGAHPLQISVGSVSLGWLSATSVNDLLVLDESGKQLLQVKSIVAGKGLLGWLTSPSDLGVIEIDGLDAVVIVGEGTSNLEEALARFISPPDQDQQRPSGASPRGRLLVHDAKLRLSERERPERWVVDISTLQLDLPEANQLLGPIELKATISESGGVVPDSIGQFKVQARQVTDGSIELRGRMDNLCLEAWHLLRARLTEMPIVAMSGRATGILAGSAIDSEHWSFDFQQLQVSQFEMSAPDLIGPSPARLQRITGAGRATLNDRRLQIRDTELDCDVGNLAISGSLPWPIEFPSLQDPFFQDGSFSAEGSIDLPRLAEAARSLIPVRDEVQLVSGRVQFSAEQRSLEAPAMQSLLHLAFSDLQAISNGQTIRWDDPLTVEFGVGSLQAGPEFRLTADAEFCNVNGSGTFQNGKLKGTADLERLHRRLNQFIDLPASQLAGAAEVDIEWDLDSEKQVTATGMLKTTPIVIATKAGTETREPAWNGQFAANLDLDHSGVPSQINRLHFELLAPEEQLVIDLHEPLRWSKLDSVDSVEPLNPAAFTISVLGDLSNWKRRGLALMAQPPDLELSGQVQMAISGRMDMEHVEISNANWDMKPVNLRLAELAFAEPQLIGNFKGRIDSQDLTRLQVDQLTIQANSFWVVAQDEPASDGQSRSGQARWMLDVQRLMQNLSAAASSNTLAASRITGAASGSQPPPESEWIGSGTSQGQLQWLVGEAGAAFQLQGKAEELALYERDFSSANSTLLWAEPSLAIDLNGKWTAKDGSVELSSINIQAPWATYEGQMAYRASDQSQELVVEGQASYDAALLSDKLQPMLGRNLQFVGQQNVPLRIRWQIDREAPEGASALAGLNASAGLGWQQARVVGIEVGRADVPITITSGVLVSAAEIPVSGGMLRWDIESDLTAENLTIVQKPMNVLENVAITPEMCNSWLKYLAPLMAEATSIDGRLSLSLNQASFTPGDLSRQTVDGELLLHRAEVGPGPLANEITGLIRQIDAIRRAGPGQPAGATNRAWLQLPPQRVSFRMVEGKVYHRDLIMEIGDATLTTSGAVDVNGNLEMVLAMPIPDSWTERGPVLATLRGQTLQFPVKGTVARPQLDASFLSQIGRQTLENAAQGLLQQGISRGLERLFRQQ